MFIYFPAILLVKTIVHTSMNEKYSGGKNAMEILHSDFQ